MSGVTEFSMLLMAGMAETVGGERRGDQLGSLLAEVDEGSDVRELWPVEDSSEDGILRSL